MLPWNRHHKHRSRLYLIYTHREITYPIKVKELFQLTQLKYIVGNKIGKELLIEEIIKLVLKGTIKPIYNTEVSKKYPKILALVGVKILLQSSLNFLQSYYPAHC
jgi:hypothetical protein